MKKELTRAQAQNRIANSSDLLYIGSFAKHPNQHIRRYVTHKIGLLQAREELKLKREELKLKRSAAAKKAAETRKARKAARTQETAV